MSFGKGGGTSVKLMKQSLLRSSHFSAGQKVTCHYRITIFTSLPLAPVQSQLNSVHILTLCFKRQCLISVHLSNLKEENTKFGEHYVHKERTDSGTVILTKFISENIITQRQKMYTNFHSYFTSCGL
jgi:hypothetical protein